MMEQRCHMLAGSPPYNSRMVIVAATADGTQQIEALYREDGDRLWRALLAFSGDPELASDAVAEAFAQALRRGAAVGNPKDWIWKAGFRIAAGELQKRGATTSLIPDVGYLLANGDVLVAGGDEGRLHGGASVGMSSAEVYHVGAGQ